jgi:hypothetical protein
MKQYEGQTVILTYLTKGWKCQQAGKITSTDEKGVRFTPFGGNGYFVSNDRIVKVTRINLVVKEVVE